MLMDTETNNELQIAHISIVVYTVAKYFKRYGGQNLSPPKSLFQGQKIQSPEKTGRFF